MIYTEKKQAGVEESNGNKERVKNIEPGYVQGNATKKKGTEQETDGIGSPTSAHGNGRPAGIAKNKKGSRIEAKGPRTASAINLDPLRDLGTKDNGSEVKDGKGPGLEAHGAAERESRGKTFSPTATLLP